MGKNVIAVLTRGYKNTADYEKLIIRNQCIYLQFYFKVNDPTNYDIIIFHEGNISKQQQKHIQEQQPLLPLIFVPVKFYSPKRNDEKCPPTSYSEQFGIGYKNMCYFWSIDFMEYLKEYDYVIRIDEDCHLKYMEPNLVQEYKSRGVHFASPYYQSTNVNEEGKVVPGMDYPTAMVGMEDLFREFLRENKIKPYIEKVEAGPYTNVMLVNIQYFRNNENVQKVLHKIKKSNCILSNRWGDLPIWGYILTLLVDPKHYIKEPRIRYYHGSHNSEISESEYKPL